MVFYNCIHNSFRLRYAVICVNFPFKTLGSYRITGKIMANLRRKELKTDDQSIVPVPRQDIAELKKAFVRQRFSALRSGFDTIFTPRYGVTYIEIRPTVTELRSATVGSLRWGFPPCYHMNIDNSVSRVTLLCVSLCGRPASKTCIFPATLKLP